MGIHLPSGGFGELKGGETHDGVNVVSLAARVVMQVSTIRGSGWPLRSQHATRYRGWY